MLSQFLTPQDKNQQLDPNATPFNSLPLFLQTAGLGLLAKSRDRDADIFGQVIPTVQQNYKNQLQQQATKNLSNELMQSEQFQNSRLKPILTALLQSNVPEYQAKAFDILTKLGKEPEAFTLAPGAKRYSATGELIAEAPLQERPTSIQANLKAAGIDPNSEEGKQMIRNYYNRPNNLGGISASGEIIPTKAVVTQNQLQVQAIDNVMPQLEKLKKGDFPGQLLGKYIHPSQQAAYEAEIGSITDQLVSALKLPKTNESLDLVKSLVQEKPFENREAFKKRVDSLISDLNSRKQNAIGSLQQTTGEPKKGQYTQENLRAMRDKALADGKDPAQVNQLYKQLGGL